jgi:hypothetical protein
MPQPDFIGPRASAQLYLERETPVPPEQVALWLRQAFGTTVTKHFGLLGGSRISVTISGSYRGSVERFEVTIERG